jgi:Fe-S-cluster-containing hydrogenase component 2
MVHTKGGENAMMLKKEKFITINKWALYTGMTLYVIGLFTPVKYLQPGLLFAFFAGFFCLLHKDYFAAKPRVAAHLWMLPVFVTLMTSQAPLVKNPGDNPGMFVLSLLTSLIPFLLLIGAQSEEKPPRKPRLKIVSFRTVVQCTIFMIWASVTSYCFIKGTRPDMLFWAMFHVFTVVMFPAFIGRLICGWICPNATLQDALFKNMTYKRPIPTLPKAIDAQSSTAAMNISGKFDARAPLFPATLLMAWFPMFFAETIWDLTKVDWYPIAFMYPLILGSMLFPWRKMCTHFCWLSPYRALNCHNSLWRIRYNRTKCKNCKVCQAEKACPFYIDIRNQDNEMPATCCLCFSCMEACPFEGVITYKRDPAEKARLKAESKGLSVPEAAVQQKN